MTYKKIKHRIFEIQTYIKILPALIEADKISSQEFEKIIFDLSSEVKQLYQKLQLLK